MYCIYYIVIDKKLILIMNERMIKMGWELKQDSKCKCWLNLDELGKTYRGYDWKNSVDKK